MVCFKCHFDFAKKKNEVSGWFVCFSDFFHNFTTTQAGCSTFQCCERKWSILHKSPLKNWRDIRSKPMNLGSKHPTGKFWIPPPSLDEKTRDRFLLPKQKMPPKTGSLISPRAVGPLVPPASSSSAVSQLLPESPAAPCYSPDDRPACDGCFFLVSAKCQ